MEIDSKDLTQRDLHNITTKLTMVVTSDYGKDKSYKIYEYDEKTKKYKLPMHWANTNLTKKISPDFKNLEKINVGRFLAEPRQLQKDCVLKCAEIYSKEWGGGIINIHTAGGKTILSLILFTKIKLKMLVVVNTVDLLQQWTKTINEFLPDVKIGKIQGAIFDTQDKQIVIGMLQTISLKDNLSEELFKDFGVTVYDEVHLISAEKFSKAFIKTRSRYVFGLSATIERKDGMEIVFKYHIGDIIFSNSNDSKKQNTIIKTIYNTNPNSKELRIYSGNPNISAMITELSEDLARTNIICKEILNLKKDRNILVLSERVSHLKIMHKILGDESSLFIGGMKENDKNNSKKKRILLATYHIASVGFDHPKLNTLVFATPRSNITQAIGRIYRKDHEITPMIIDIVDTYSVFPYQYKKRKTIYKNSIESQVEPEVECLFD